MKQRERDGYVRRMTDAVRGVGCRSVEHVVIATLPTIAALVQERKAMPVGEVVTYVEEALQRLSPNQGTPLGGAYEDAYYAARKDFLSATIALYVGRVPASSAITFPQVARLEELLAAKHHLPPEVAKLKPETTILYTTAKK